MTGAARPRVVVAGLGDTGLLVALHLARHADVVGISAKPGLVSGQELGLRLARPEVWRQDYWIDFDRFRGLDGVRTVHGSLVGVDPTTRQVQVRGTDGTETTEPYDALVVATGVRNGFWRTPALEHRDEVAAAIGSAHDRLAVAGRVAVVGGGAAAVSSAWNIADAWPGTRVDLYFPGERALVHHHPRVWDRIARRMTRRGIGLHPGHRAVAPARVTGIEAGPVTWSTGQPPAAADAVVWAIGRVEPNTAWLPRAWLDAQGFVQVDEYLRVRGTEGGGTAGVWAIGDVAASDPLRSSARARADHLLARNVRAALGGGRLRTFTPQRRRWGSVLGAQHDRLEVFSPGGTPYVIPAWRFLQPWLVQRAIYGGIRPPR